MKKLKLVPHAKQRLHERFGIESTKFGVLTYKKLEFIKKMSNNRKIYKINGTDIYIVIKTDKALILTILKEGFKHVRKTKIR